MPRQLAIPKKWENAGWRIKVSDKEEVEPPHVTIIQGPLRWRFGLREQAFLDRKPPAREVPKELVEWLRQHQKDCVDAWDALYGSRNPVHNEADDE